MKRKSLQSLPPIVAVIWLDACGPRETDTFTRDEAESLDILTMVDVGFLLKSTRRCLILASQISDEQGFRRIITIPTAIIKEKLVLRGRR